MALVDEYSKEELEQIVKNANSLKEVIDKLGYKTHSGSNNETVKTKLKEYNIDFSHFKTPVRIKRNEENVFIENSTASQKTLRDWYLKGNYTPYICSICGQEPIWQGKDLTLILDHINGSNHDDRLENLRWVCPNCNQQLDTTNGKNVKILNKKYYCIDCKMPITREELKKLIRTTPFTTIATQFGVTDNAIRKWCDKFNLPRTKKEIISYDDEEWTLI